MLVLISMVIYFLLLSLTHWEERYYFFMARCMRVSLRMQVFVCFESLGREVGQDTPAFAAIPLILFAVMWSIAFAESRKQLVRFLGTHPTEIIAACDYLKSEGVSGARIVARKPHLPAICGGEWIFFPQVQSFDELKEWLRTNEVDCIAWGIREQLARVELGALKDPHAAPPWLKPVWVSAAPPFVLYKPQVE